MKCKICKEEIYMVIFGMPDDLCWGCANKDEKDIVLEKNIFLKNKKIKKEKIINDF